MQRLMLICAYLLCRPHADPMLTPCWPYAGKNWSKLRTIVGSDHEVGGYVAPIVDMVTKQILILYNVLFSQTWLIRSADNGML